MKSNAYTSLRSIRNAKYCKQYHQFEITTMRAELFFFALYSLSASKQPTSPLQRSFQKLSQAFELSYGVQSSLIHENA